MATRRRRPTATTLTKVPDGSWEDFSSEAPELSHEEMLEIAEEREEVAMAAGVADTFEAAMAEAEREEVEEFLAVTAADTFESLQAAEEVKGLDGFFDPTPVRPPAVTVPAKKKAAPNHTHQRVITRSRKS